jgi:iron complex outermembrane recepter protein
MKNLKRIMNLVTHVKLATLPTVMTLLMIWLLCLNVSAQQLQDKLNISFASVTLKQAFSELTQRTHYKFSYNNDDIDLSKKIMLKGSQQTFKNVLDEMAKQASFTYVQKDETIIILPVAEKKFQVPKKAGVADITISGQVVDNDGKPLAGVTIKEKGTNNSVTTDASGNYTITVSENAVLLFSQSGKTSQSISVLGQSTINITLASGGSASQSAATQTVQVIGTRSNIKRTKVGTPLAVDVLSNAELLKTGQVEIGQMIQFTSPSFNSTKNGVNGATNYADPATLRGLSPDQTLVLINGKRRHQFSALNLNITLGKGTVTTDMNTIPSLAIDRIEVLRDGAAAQYGSDAIAGVINMSLKKGVKQGSARIHFGNTKEGDGTAFNAGVNYGFKLGKPKSYLNFTMQYQNSGATDRSDPFTGNIYFAANAPNSAFREDSARQANGVWPTKASGTQFKVLRYGSNETVAYQFFVNAGYPINNNWSLYSFGGISKKDITANGFFRNAISSDANSNIAVAPNGYTPVIPGDNRDYSLAVGAKREVAKGWNVDLSTVYGYNSLDQYNNNTTNPSMGAASPRNFYVGQSAFGQSSTEVIFTRDFGEAIGLKSFNLALGSQFRIDNYKLKAGDEFSYFAGPLASSGKFIGASARPGIAPSDAIDTTRTNIGIFADVETDLSEKFLTTLALRYENYSDFGSNLSGKFALRYKITENFSLRGSVNRGFRAPSLQQIYNSVTTSTAQAGMITQTKQLPSSDPRLVLIGVETPKAETSWSYSGGVTASVAKGKLLFTADAYQIDIKDRIIITENLRTSQIAALQSNFTGLQEVSFFTNNINTKTTGLEVVASYRQNNNGQGFTGNFALSLNKTLITNTQAAPAALQLGTTNPIKLIDTISIALIETSQPREKYVFSLGYKYKAVELTVRNSYFGDVTVWEKPANIPHRSQKFGSKIITDLVLSYDISKTLNLNTGVNNLFDVYPDKNRADYSAYTSGQIPYTRNASQFGFNGMFYFVNLTLKF